MTPEMRKDSQILLKKGTLWQDIVRTTERAIRSGALLPIPTDYEFVEDSGIRFFVRILSSLKRKEEARRKMEEASVSGKSENPFLPYDGNLFVSDVSESHIALLNKFNVVEHHLLIVTRHFEDQEALLTIEDFEALWACMAEYSGLGFYNGGGAAGASQRHKHLQMVPLPLAPEGPEVPIEPLLAEAKFPSGPGIIHGFPFLHFFSWLPDDIISSTYAAARKTFKLYSIMLREAGLNTPDAEILKKQSAPYCLLLTRHWMLIIPRAREFFDSISINSLGFAGALLVHNKEQIELLKKHGLMFALKTVALPR
ncbi:MAG: phosphorylase [Nitrospirae bacterium]|jgi:sulfate adenylyltransferase (ADP) / ATP adenylyltransferase|nr:phosphorylase [Nitrospirota bacterium]